MRGVFYLIAAALGLGASMWSVISGIAAQLLEPLLFVLMLLTFLELPLRRGAAAPRDRSADEAQLESTNEREGSLLSRADLSVGPDGTVSFGATPTFPEDEIGQLDSRRRRSQGFLLFVGICLVLNFVVAPLVVWGLVTVFPVEPTVRFGIVLVLIAPCIDYVVVFTRMVGGAHAMLLFATPILLLVQILALPLLVPLIADVDTLGDQFWLPLIRAFVVFIVVPLVFAFVLQMSTQHSTNAANVVRSANRSMDVVMCAVLFVVVASQATMMTTLRSEWFVVLLAYVSFEVTMFALGRGITARTGLRPSERRAVAMSGVTRNSLVVMPIALALPRSYDAVPLVIAMQTVVEIAFLLIVVRFQRRLFGDDAARSV